MFNFDLFHTWCEATFELGLEVYSKDGGCIYMKDPTTGATIGKEGDPEQHFFFMLWTPLNKLHLVYRDLENGKNWDHALHTLKDNISDFHIEAAKYHCRDQSHYNWFPEINYKASKDITVDDIIKCVERIRDFDNHDKWQTYASMRA